MTKEEIKWQELLSREFATPTRGTGYDARGDRPRSSRCRHWRREIQWSGVQQLMRQISELYKRATRKLVGSYTIWTPTAYRLSTTRLLLKHIPAPSARIPPYLQPQRPRAPR